MDTSALKGELRGDKLSETNLKRSTSPLEIASSSSLARVEKKKESQSNSCFPALLL